MSRRPRLLLVALAAMGIAILAACGSDERPRAPKMSTQAVSFAVWYAPGAPDDFKALETMLTQGGTGTVRQYMTWSEWIGSKADVLVLRGFLGSPVPDDLEPLKARRVIGIGDEAGRTFDAMGLDLTHGATSVAEEPSVILGEGPLVPRERAGERVVALREPVPLGAPEPIACDGVFLPEDEALATQVEALARWSHDPDYAPLTGQGNMVFCAIKPNLKVWTPAFRSAFRAIAVSLGRTPLQPFKLSEWDITPPGTYTFQLGIDGPGGPPAGRTYFFKFASPVVFSAELEMRQGGEVALDFRGQASDRAFDGRTTQHGESLVLVMPLTEPSLTSNGQRYWELRVQNFDRATPVEATLRIAYESNATIRLPDGLEVPVQKPPRDASTIDRLIKHLASDEPTTVAKAIAALQLAGGNADTALDAAWETASEVLRERISIAQFRIDTEHPR